MLKYSPLPLYAVGSTRPTGKESDYLKNIGGGANIIPDGMTIVGKSFLQPR